MIRRIDRGLVAAVSAEAKQSARGRKNHNFHPGDEYPAHRLLNAVEPGSYITPHRHLDPNKDETMVCVAGRMGVLSFDEAGKVVEIITLAPGAETFGVDIPHGVYHTVLALEPGTVFVEAKSGPYLPLTEAEFAPWAPAEGSAGVKDFYRRLRALFPA